MTPQTQPRDTAYAARPGGRDILRTQSVHEQEEKAHAIRALLMKPLLTAGEADDRESLRLVRRHASDLIALFRRELGWRLTVEREYARLHKIPGDLSDDTRGWDGFNRRRYAIFCLVCATLERADHQITLRSLGENVLTLAGDADLFGRGFSIDMRELQDRRDLAAACRKLGALGVLTAVDGDVEAYVQSGGSEDGSKDALYDVHRGPLSSLLVALRGPSSWSADDAPKTNDGRIAGIMEEFHPDTEEAGRDATRYRIARRLIDDPVVYNDSVSDGDRPYFINQRGALAKRLADAAGLIVELRSEGIALCDPDGSCSDVAMPAEGTDAHVTLLVADLLAHSEGDVHDMETVERFVAASATQYKRYWRKSTVESPNGARELTEIAIGRLVRLNLIAVNGDSIETLPALFRYKLGEPEIRQRGDLDRLDDLIEENGE